MTDIENQSTDQSTDQPNERTVLIGNGDFTNIQSPYSTLGRSQSTPEIFDSIYSLRRRGRSNTVSSIVSNSLDIVKQHMDKKKFVYLISASLLLYLAFVAVFAPRTSLSRDFRRWHNSKLTTSEVYRIYLDTLREDNFIHNHLKNFSRIDNSVSSLQYTNDGFEKLGFETKFETYYPWVTLPLDSGVQLIKNGTIAWEATMLEDCLDDDPKKCQENNIKGFHGYSPNGEITGQYVYCNYGTLEDYKKLLDNNIDIEGKIHIIRNGKLFRGIKVKNAELYGASSVILYSDPFDDGLITVKNGFKAYPEGPARNPSSFERGSVEFLTEFPGDPTTPNFPSKSSDIERLSPVGKIPRIPSVPMSSKEIAPLLAELNDKGVRFDTDGDIEGFNYFTGPSNLGVEISLFSKQSHSIINITNIVVDIPGIFSDSEIIIGSHRDSWLSHGGASDPNSGSAILLEIARGISKLRKKGWIPLRPIKLISWDASELALVGSTEYVEEHSSNLKNNALAYINLDTAVSGSYFACKANKLLHDAIFKAAKLTSYKGKEDYTLFDKWQEASNNTIDYLGGGTDASAFQYHLGIAAAEFKFENDGKTDAIYHQNSVFDSHKWMEEYIDPEYKLHNTLATFTGLFALMMSEKEVHNIKAHPYLKDIYGQFSEMTGLIEAVFPHDEELYNKGQSALSSINMATFQDSIYFDKRIEVLYKRCFEDLPVWSFAKKLRLYINLLTTNRKLKHFDRLFVTVNGLNDREFMKYSLLAPDKYVGYRGDVLPGLHEALIEMNRPKVVEWLDILQTQFDSVRTLLK